MRYFITFACYGAHLHGDESGSVDRHHNVFGSPLARASPERVAIKREQMDQAPYFLDSVRRTTVLGALREVCLHRSWVLLAAHVRNQSRPCSGGSGRSSRDGNERFQGICQSRFELCGER